MAVVTVEMVRGLVLVGVLVAAVVVLWPLYRWALRWLGVVFVVFGIWQVLTGSGATDRPVEWRETVGLVGGGAVMFIITQPRTPARRDPEPVPPAATARR